MAILSDPQLGPGMTWPDWTGAQILGERSRHPDTVAVVALNETMHNMRVLEDVGDPRAIWMEFTTQDRNLQDVCTLVLAVYAFPPNRMVCERLAFWHERLWELQRLRREPCFRDAPLVLAGDLNLHVASLSRQDARLERPVDREIWMLLTSASGFGLISRNPADVPTHKDGAVLDHVLTHASLDTRASVAPERDLLSSDHHPVVIRVLGRTLAAHEVPTVGKDFCDRQADWDQALRLGMDSLMFVAAWAHAITKAEQLKQSVAEGKRRKLKTWFYWGTSGPWLEFSPPAVRDRWH